MSDEAHFSAEQPRAQAPARFPYPVCNPGRSQDSGSPSGSQPQETVRVAVLKRRADFLAANRGKRVAMPAFVLLVYHRHDDNLDMRVGYTVTKKTGNAVVRNRIKRRFRALVQSLLPVGGVEGADHILIGRRAAFHGNFDDLYRQLSKALARMRR